MRFMVTGRAWVRCGALALLFAWLAACGAGPAASDRQEAPQAVNRTPVQDEGSYAVVEREVKFEAAGMTIHGTLTRPLMRGRYGAVVLIAGSGPTDRDWSGPLLPGGNGSGALLARELARHGLVVLRYDKRGTGQTDMPGEPVRWGHYLEEIEAAVALARDEPVVDPQRVVLAGHSEGAWHAIEFAQTLERRQSIAGLALLAPAGRGLATVVLEQVEASLFQAGLAPEAVAQEVARLEGALAAVAAGEEVDPAQASQYPGLQNLVASFQDPSARPFVQAILLYDPVRQVRQVGRPVLIVAGGKDIQIDFGRDARPLGEAARAAGLEVTEARPPQADHVLKREEGDLRAVDRALVGARYNAPDRDLDPEAVEALIRWLQRL